MSKKDYQNQVLKILKSEFPEVKTPLKHNSAFQLLVATVLSPQTLDSTTNKVTPAIFKKYPNPKLLANANLDQLENEIKIVNYYKTKAKNLKKMAQILLQKFNGVVPSNLNNLIELPGVGRKVANVIISEWFFKTQNIEPEGIVVDTHVKRVSFRLGLTKETDPYKVEKDLNKQFPKNEWADLSLRFIFHGRKTCKAKNPLCSSCPLKNICPQKGLKRQ